MEIVSLVLCEAANVMPDGRFNVLGGGISQLRASRFPLHVSMGLVLQIRSHIAEAGAHQLGLRLMNADGHDVIPPLKLPLEVRKDTRMSTGYFQLNNVRFERDGAFSFEVLLDGQLKQSWPMLIAKIPPSEAKAEALEPPGQSA